MREEWLRLKHCFKRFGSVLLISWGQWHITLNRHLHGSVTVLMAFAKSSLPGIGLILLVSVSEKHFRKLVRNFCDRKPGLRGRIFFRRHHHFSVQRWGLFYKQQHLPQQFLQIIFAMGLSENRFSSANFTLVLMQLAKLRNRVGLKWIKLRRKL